MQPENSFTVQLTGGISSVDTLENGMELFMDRISTNKNFSGICIIQIFDH